MQSPYLPIRPRLGGAPRVFFFFSHLGQLLQRLGDDA